MYIKKIILVISFLHGINSLNIENNVLSKQPTNQPSYFEAPSIPKDLDLFVPIPNNSNEVYSKDPYNGVHKADNINEELEEETKTAINGVTYIFYTFIIMVGCVFAAYLWKKPNSNDNMRIYQPVERNDPSEYFSKHDLELT